MKLHLPVRLFRSLMALMLSVPASLYAAYSAPTSITIPSGYSSVTVDALEDITVYGSDSSDVAFRLDGAALTEGMLVGEALSSSIMTQLAGSWYITSDSVDSLASLSFCNANSRLFKVYSNESLEISALKRLLFDTNEYSHTTSSNEGYACYGGVVYGMDNSRISLTQNESVTFCGNSVSSSSGIYGALIYGGNNSNIFICENGSTSFSENTASSTDGSVCGGVIGGTFITLCGNESLSFTKNSVTSILDYTTWASGGALYGSSITLRGNGSLMFCGNSVSSSYFADGGAIYSFNGGVSLNGNGTLIFSKNTASSSLYDNAKGGAIYSHNGNVSLNGNGDVTISENSASSASQASLGGAIYVDGNLNIQNNDSVLFEKNAEITKGVYRLRSIYAEGSGKSVISFSSADGNSVEFRDSIYIADGATVNLNSDYTDEDGVGHKQAGDIVFTGAYTETHLNALLTDAEAGRVATAEEILNSRTSEVYALTNLYGGRLRVEDGAIYMGRGITAYENSGATVRVKNATLNHKGYDLTFKSGTMLELSGSNSIIGDVLMQDGSWLAFDGSETTGTTFMKGDLTFDGVSNISLSGYSNWSGQNEILLCVEGEFSGWDVDSLTIRNGDSSSVDIRWVNGGLLVLNYNAETFNPYINGDVTFTSHQDQLQEYCYYSSVEFEGNFSSSGGALYGEYDSRVALRRNGDVNFTSNTARYYGGAIYGSDISLIGNRAVTFTRNQASDYGCAQGGAIYGSNVNLSGNGNITFIGNSSEALDSDYLWAYGGAIYGGSISLCGNKVVTFCSNIASTFYHHSYENKDSSPLGGAIYADGNLSIQNNDSVLFEKNAEIADSTNRNGSYRLRSIYAGGSGDVISLSAAENKSIEFRDSIYIRSGASVSLNADYTDEKGVVQKQGGDIIFTGAYTESHLNEVLVYAGVGRGATSSEILNSRTSEVYAMTNLYGGRLRVEDGAIYQGYGITAMEGSNATVRVKDATLSHSGYDLIFNAGTTLELVGNNSISGNVLMKEGSWLSFDGSESMAMSTLMGNLTFVDGVNVTLSDNADWSGKNEILLRVVGNISGWNETALTIRDGATDISMIEGGWLVLNYDAETFNPYFKGDATFNSHQNTLQEYSLYNSLVFENVSYYSDGGAIYGGDIVLNNNSSVIFRDNEIDFSTYLEYPDGDEWTKKMSGAAIYGRSISLCGNDSLIFSRNEASCSIDTYHTYLDVAVKVEGGAIYGDSESSVSLIGNQNVSFNGNSAHAYTSVADRLFNYYSHRVNAKGGAISALDVYFANNGDIEFSENSSSVVLYGYDYYGREVPVDSSTTYSYAEGGAIYGTNVDLRDNESVTFRDNTVSSIEGLAYAYGGAISGTNIAFNRNGSVTFAGNIASAQSSSEAVAQGGAIYGNNIVINNNDSVIFDGNTASAQSSSDSVAQGGAIYGSKIDLLDNESVTFKDNAVSSSGDWSRAVGGAIYGNNISLNNNGGVSFIGNSASVDSYDSSASCGAIYATGNLSIQNNDSVLFEKNAEITEGSYRLRSIYAGGSSDIISFSAGAGKSIEFRDGVYIQSGSTVRLNADYTDSTAAVHKQTGDIIFTGKYAETHLNDILRSDGVGRTATEDELQASRTTQVHAITNIYGGRLRIEDGAIFKGNGITAHVNSGSTVRVQDSVLEHSGSNLTFNAGTTLELAGNNSISGNINMLEGSTLSFDVSEKSTISVINGSVHFEDDVALSVITDNTLLRENTILMLVNGSITGWNSADQRFFLFGESLVYNYNKDTFDGYFMGDREFATRQSDGVNMKYYRSLSFSNITNEAPNPYGGAISGNMVTMSYNRSVDFIGNSVEGSEGLGGGAIYGNEIILNNNGNVSFIGNTACTDDTTAYVYGGAIDATSIKLSGNDTVSFIDNKASAVSDGCVYMQGGAITGDNITLSKNGTVTFSGNSISSNSSSDFCQTYGGAIYGAINCSSVILSDNGLVTFTDNTAASTSTYEAATTGGAIDATSIKLSGNETVTFRGNGVSTTILFDSDNGASSGSSYTAGGAIRGQEVSLINNEVVTFDANTASSTLSNINESYITTTRGGAISGSNISLCGNGAVTFSSNSVSSSSPSYAEVQGGAIYAGNISIRNNDSVLFEKNVEVTNGSYRLRSIYANGLSLSAAQNKSIEIRDSIYISSGSVVKLNADYTDENGVVHKQTGDIIFTGAYTETHLNDLLEDAGAGRVATAGEILNSRTSEVYAMTNLYGGRLRVEDGAIYQGYGITAMEGSNATVRVKDATLSHSGYDLIFHDGTLLEIDGVSTVNGNVELLSGSTLNLLANSTLNMGVESCLNAENGANIALGTDATLNLEGAFEAGDAVILELSDGAAVSRGVTTICNNGGKDVVQLDAVAFASGTMQKVKDAHVVVDSSEDTSITYQLENASVENRGGGKLTMTHENNSISSVSAAGGDVEILNVDSSDRGNILKLASLELHESAVFGAYVGDTVSADAEACVQVSGSAVFGVGTTVNADLVLMDGCVLTMDDTVRMGSDLSINGTLTLDGDLLSLIQNAEIGMHFDLFTGIDDLYLNGVLFDSIALTDNMSASTYFIGLEDVPESERYYRLAYASETPGEGVLSVHVVFIPEPTAATLGILALAGLAARRRRRW